MSTADIESDNAGVIATLQTEHKMELTFDSLEVNFEKYAMARGGIDNINSYDGKTEETKQYIVEADTYKRGEEIKVPFKNADGSEVTINKVEKKNSSGNILIEETSYEKIGTNGIKITDTKISPSTDTLIITYTRIMPKMVRMTTGGKSSTIKPKCIMLVNTNAEGKELRIYLPQASIAGGLEFSFPSDKAQDVLIGKLSFSATLAGSQQSGEQLAWYEDEQCTIAFESTVMPEGHLTIYAKWTIQTFTIFTSTTAGGWISPSGQSIVEWGDSLAITVGVETGYQLESVIIDNTPLNETQLSSILSEGLLLLNIRENHDISFTFGKKLYTITYILDNNNYNVASYYYQAQTTAPQSPTFEYYEYFDGWYSDDNYTTQHEFSLMPADDLTLYGRSLDVEYNIYAQVQGKSQISPSSQILTYPEDATFSIDLADGYEIADVTIDGKQVTEEELEEIKASLSIPFSIDKYAYRSQNKQSEDHTIVLHVSPLTYNITFDINYSDEEQSYQFDTDQTIQLPPAPQRRGYTFEGWYTEEECVNQFTLTTMPAQDVKLFAKWSIIVYTVNTKTNEGGQITPSGNSGVEFGNSITYNFNPNVGYHVESICVDGVYLNNQSLSQAVLYGLTIDNVEENHSIDVKFAINTYKVLISVYGYGDFISNSEDSVFEYGDTVQFRTTTNLDNYYMDVYVNNNLVETDHGMLTIDNIDQDMTIVVRFTKKPFFKTVDGLVTIIILLTVVFVIVISAITIIFRRKNLYRNMDRY